MTIKITVLALSRPFFMLEWEREKKKLIRTDLKSRLYNIQMPEVDKEIVKATQWWMERLEPAIVFLDGSPASMEMQICSPEAAAKYVEKDYVGIHEDYRAEMAKELGRDVVYLDEGFGEINRYYWAQKRYSESVFLIDEMIRQILEKESYALETLKDLKKHEGFASKDTVLIHEWWKRFFTISDLVKAKTSALWVKGEDNFPAHTVEPLEHDQPVDVLLKTEKDVKKIESIRLEGRTQEGREDYWIDKSEEEISELPEGSQVLFIIEARHVGFYGDVDSYDPYKEFDLPKGALVDWGVKDCGVLPVGKFHEKLKRLGKVQVIDLTQDAMKRALEGSWKI